MWSRRAALSALGTAASAVSLPLTGCLGGAGSRGDEPTPPATTATRTRASSRTSTPPEGTETTTTRPETETSATTESLTPERSETPTRTATPAATATVTVSRGAFTPRRLAVEPNTRVVWRNESVDSHRIRSATFGETTGWEFESASFGRDGAVDYVFRETGVYGYFSPTFGRRTSCGVVLVGDVGYDGRLPCESGEY